MNDEIEIETQTESPCGGTLTADPAWLRQNAFQFAVDIGRTTGERLSADGVLVDAAKIAAYLAHGTITQ